MKKIQDKKRKKLQKLKKFNWKGGFCYKTFSFSSKLIGTDIGRKAFNADSHWKSGVSNCNCQLNWWNLWLHCWFRLVSSIENNLWTIEWFDALVVNKSSYKFTIDTPEQDQSKMPTRER